MTKVRAHSDVACAVMLAAVVIALYSFWGAHIVAGNNQAPVASAQENLR